MLGFLHLDIEMGLAGNFNAKWSIHQCFSSVTAIILVGYNDSGTCNSILMPQDVFKVVLKDDEKVVFDFQQVLQNTLSSPVLIEVGMPSNCRSRPLGEGRSHMVV